MPANDFETVTKTKLYIQVSLREYKRLYKFFSGQTLDEKIPGFFPLFYIKSIPIIISSKRRKIHE